MKNLSLVLVSLLLSPCVWAQAPEFDNLSNAEVADAIKDFGSVLSHTSVSPASSLGDVFGFEVGLVAGMVETPGVDQISKSVDPTSEVEELPHAGLFAAVSFPLGLTAEINYLPEYESEDMDFKNTSLGLKWTFSQLLTLPVDAAVRVSTTNSELEFSQTNPAPNTVTVETKSQEVMFLVSKNFLVVEPYAGIGYISVDGDVSSTVDIFTDVAGLTVSQKESGSHFLVGANFNLLIVKLGVEAGKLLDSQKISAKLSFYF